MMSGPITGDRSVRPGRGVNVSPSGSLNTERNNELNKQGYRLAIAGTRLEAPLLHALDGLGIETVNRI